ncbi:hypothetical protein GCM10010435_93950 [Winogradskya consettensis]|uniref:HTH-like domain-containing protein n=1 Tax=Winogradskya consettensis TaxID=113560 RepID=A0A919W1Y5_9ACTN|nr:IS3 family transposase [Actinoplanes consettensis]GIM84473.1 hypothetical protein Aco04nite_91560 [Actinoplanes consettensis]
MTFVAELREWFGVEPILRVLGIATSTFYGWLKQAAEPSHRCRQDAIQVEDIGRIHERSGQMYGSPRVHATLRRQGHQISRKRVERLMREQGAPPRHPRWICSALR